MAESGLVIANTEAIRSFLLAVAVPGTGDAAACDGGHLTGELRDLAASLSSQPTVPYRSLRAIWSAAAGDCRPSLRKLLVGAEFVFCSPKPREKSDELKARLKKLAEMQEKREYAELVKDVAPKRASPEPFSTYKDQIGFGLHVVLIMFTGYLVGFTAFRALFNNSSVMNAAGGILGLVCGMLMETVLFIIRASNQDLASSAPASRSKKLQ